MITAPWKIIFKTEAEGEDTVIPMCMLKEPNQPVLGQETFFRNNIQAMILILLVL